MAALSGSVSGWRAVDRSAAHLGPAHGRLLRLARQGDGTRRRCRIVVSQGTVSAWSVAPTSPRRAVARQLSLGALGGAPPELVAMLNLLTNLAIAITLVIVLYTLTVCYWKHRMNKRYYLQKKRRASTNAAHSTADEAQPTAEEVSFVPFPRSLLFPNPLYFVAAAFVGGLSRNSVQLLVSKSADCTTSCRVVGAGVLAAVVLAVLLVAADLTLFRWRHRGAVRWKPATAVSNRDAITDPIMRLTAASRAATVASAMVARHRTSHVTRHLSSKRLSRLGSIKVGRLSSKALVVPITASFKRPTNSFRKRTGFGGGRGGAEDLTAVDVTAAGHVPSLADTSASSHSVDAADADSSLFTAAGGSSHGLHTEGVRLSDSFKARIRLQENSFSGAPSRGTRQRPRRATRCGAPGTPSWPPWLIRRRQRRRRRWRRLLCGAAQRQALAAASSWIGAASTGASAPISAQSYLLSAGRVQAQSCSRAQSWPRHSPEPAHYISRRRLLLQRWRPWPSHQVLLRVLLRVLPAAAVEEGRTMAQEAAPGPEAAALLVDGTDALSLPSGFHSVRMRQIGQ